MLDICLDCDSADELWRKLGEPNKKALTGALHGRVVKGAVCAPAWI